MSDDLGVEEWRAVVGATGYEVSDHGRVRSLPRVTCDGKRLRGQMRKAMLHWSGHVYVAIWINGKGRNRYIHGLVLEAFVGPCPPGEECRHLNGVANDNTLKNLAWGTHSENMRDRTPHGTDNRGSRQGRSRLTNFQVQAMRALLMLGAKGRTLARIFGVHEVTVSNIKRGATWWWLPWPNQEVAA